MSVNKLRVNTLILVLIVRSPAESVARQRPQAAQHAVEPSPACMGFGHLQRHLFQHIYTVKYTVQVQCDVIGLNIVF
jgi:hypothetical protein